MKFCWLIGLFVLLLPSCDVSYGMLDGSIEGETFSVEVFEEEASNAPAGYGISFTEFLRDYMLSRTKLNLKKSEADIEISGKIVGYQTSPAAVQSDENAALNQLEVTIAVTVINNVNEKQSFRQNFRQFSNYNASLQLSSVEEQLLEDINGRLSQDIVNKLSSEW
ncbi:MAG: LPS assembly lipoprotein LptE [Crocinitomicaceae bacterium]|nr:LPS assembly lipoprotein LptE [Crocinitomicaceae bacterium]